MTITIVAIHQPVLEHLAKVRAEMQTRGAPSIRCIWLADHSIWMAIEGSHRLAAAHELGLTPEILDASEEDDIPHDLQDLASPASAAELVEEIGTTSQLNRGAWYNFEHEEES